MRYRFDTEIPSEEEAEIRVSIRFFLEHQEDLDYRLDPKYWPQPEEIWDREAVAKYRK